MSAHDHVEQVLARNKLRYTKLRRRIVELMEDAGRPVTLPELRAADSELPQSSLYRNLDILARVGLVTRILGSNHDSFELADTLMAHHHHLICDSCGLITDVYFDAAFDLSIATAINEAAEQFGFSPERHSVDLHGHCTDCAA